MAASARAARSFAIRPVAGRIAVLASGGLDSSALIGELARGRRTVYPVYIQAGLRWEREELAALRRFIRALNRPNLRPVTVLRIPMDDVARRHWTVTGRRVPGLKAALTSNYILGRNLALLTKGAIFCAHHRIGLLAMGSLGTNPFPDASEKFLRVFERTAALGLGLRLRVITPYAGMTKPQVIARTRALPLGLTLTCANPRGAAHCWACTKCAERNEAFAAAGVPDPARSPHRRS